MELRQVPPAALDLSLGRLRQIPQAAVRAMVESLRSKGQLSQLVAAEQAGELVLVDGFVRHLAAVRLGLDAVLVEVVKLSAVQMKAQLYLRNRERGLLLLEECRLVHELGHVDGLNQVEIGDLLERHKSWVSRRLSLYRDLSPGLFEDMSLGLLGAGSLRRLAQLPARNQEQLMAVAQRDGLSDRDTASLIELWSRTTDPEARRYLLDHPGDAVERARSEPAEATDPRLGEAARQLVSALCTLTGVGVRVQRRIADGIGALPSEGLAVVDSRHRQAAEQCAAAFEAVDGWVRTNRGPR